MDISNRILILIAIAIILFNLSYCIYLKKSDKFNISLNRMDFKSLVIHIILSIIVGIAIKTVSTKEIVEIISKYNEYIFQIFTALILMLTIETLFYKNSKLKILSKYSEVLSYLTYATILALVATNNINIENLICSIIWASIFYSIRFYEDILQEEGLLVNERNDEPITKKSQLYPQRRTELEHIENYINEHVKNSSCTISVCADWGEGKTSFINVIKGEVSDKKDYVIFMQPMIMDKRENLIEYFFSQMEGIMKKEGIYTGKGSSISNYFDSIMNIIGKDTKSFFDGIFVEKESSSKDYRELKAELQKDINKILSINSENQGKLILLVDDFDRVEEDVMYHILTFIKEIASFTGCLVIFLMDYKNIKNKNITREYLDKFVSKKFELKKIDREELLKHYIYNNIYFDEGKIENKIIKEQYINFKENIHVYLNNIEKSIKSKKLKLNEDRSKDGVTNIEIEKIDKDLEIINSYIKKYKELSSNPRKLKKLLIEIEETCKFIYKKYENEKEQDIRSTYNTLNCNEIIFNMSAIKILFEEEFDELVDSLDIVEYMKNIKYTNIIRILFDVEDLSSIFNEIKRRRHEEKCKFINENFINSHRYSKSIIEIKTKNREILKKLNEGTINKSEENYEITDVLNAIYEFNPEKDINQLKKELELLYEYIVYIISDKKIKFNEVIDLILQYKSRIYYSDNIESVKLILECIILKLLNNKYTYISIKERDMNLYYISDFNKHIVYKSIRIISSLLRCAKIDDNSNDYEIIYNTISKKESIKEINNLAMNILGKCADRSNEQTKESQILNEWVEESIEGFNNNNTIEAKYKQGLKYIQQYMQCFVKIIEILEIIEKNINNTKIKPIYEIVDMYVFDNIENLENEISMLKEYVSNISEIKDIKKLYRFFDQIIVAAYKAIKLQEHYEESIEISKTCIYNLSYIYDTLNQEYKVEYIEPLLWSDCTLKMIDIKKIIESKVTN